MLGASSNCRLKTAGAWCRASGEWLATGIESVLGIAGAVRSSRRPQIQQSILWSKLGLGIEVLACERPWIQRT